MKRESIENVLTFKEFFSKWQTSHDQPDTPPEEVPGPLVPYLKLVYKFSKGLARFGFSPNKMTVLSFLIVLYSIFFFGLGADFVFLAGLFIGISGILDNVDGCIAGILNKGSNFGAYFDAIMDKFGDIILMIGPILYLYIYPAVFGPFFLDTLGPSYLFRYFDIFNTSHFSFFIILGLVTIATTLIQEYCRARQEGLGLLETKVTIGERPFRIITVSVLIGIVGGSYWSQYNPAFNQGALLNNHIFYAVWLIPIMISISFVISIISIMQLSIHGWKHLDETR